GSDAEGPYRGRAVAITGASGFVGSALRRRLAASGAVVPAVSRQERPPDAPAERWWKLDVSVPAAPDELLHATAPEVLFHLAGETSAGRELELVRPTFTANAVA